MTKYQEYKQKAQILDALAEFVRGGYATVDTFHLRRDLDLTLDRNKGVWRVNNEEPK